MAGGAGAGGYAQMGTALSGDIVGGIGSLIAGENYKRPRLPPATGYEQRLRQLAQSQLLGGGQQLLGATALYNQMAPILMGMLPGMHYIPGSAADPSMPGSGAASSSPMTNYQHALQNFQQQQGLQQQLTGLNRQIKYLHPGAQRKALKQQKRTVRGQLQQMPTAAQLERQEFMGATQPDQSMYNISQASAPATPPTADSLAAIRSLMDSYSSGSPNLSNLYQQQIGGGGML